MYDGKILFFVFLFYKVYIELLNPSIVFYKKKLKISSEIIDNNVVFFNIIFSHQEEFRTVFFKGKNKTSFTHMELLGNYVIQIR